MSPTPSENFTRERLSGKPGFRSFEDLARFPKVPATYEIGVATDDYLDGVETTYAGETSDVRTRAQTYARNGSHLGKRDDNVFDNAVKNGFIIYIRYLPQKTKEAAYAMESIMLHGYDYAWNKVGQRKTKRRDLLPGFARRHITDGVDFNVDSDEDVRVCLSLFPRFVCTHIDIIMFVYRMRIKAGRPPDLAAPTARRPTRLASPPNSERREEEKKRIVQRTRGEDLKWSTPAVERPTSLP